MPEHEFDSSQTCNYCGIAEERTKRGDQCPNRGSPMSELRAKPTTRLQFMSGHWPDDEEPMGGLCEDALKNVLAFELRNFFADAEEARQ